MSLSGYSFTGARNFLNTVSAVFDELFIGSINVGSKLLNHESRIQVVEEKNLEQDGQIEQHGNMIQELQDEQIVQNSRLTTHDQRLGANDIKNSQQDQRLDIIENKNTTQDSRLSSIESINTTQDSRLSSIESINTAQDTRLSSIESKNTTQDTRLSSIESINTTQDSRLSSIESKNTTQDSRLSSVESKLPLSLLSDVAPLYWNGTSVQPIPNTSFTNNLLNFNLTRFGHNFLDTQLLIQGAYIGWNTNNGTGETDLINKSGNGPGGFYFYNSTGNGTAFSVNKSLLGMIRPGYMTLGMDTTDSRKYIQDLRMGANAVSEEEQFVLRYTVDSQVSNSAQFFMGKKSMWPDGAVYTSGNGFNMVEQGTGDFHYGFNMPSDNPPTTVSVYGSIWMPKNQSLWLTDDNVVGDELASKLRVHLSSDGDGFIDFGSSKTFNIRKGTSTKLQIRSDGKVNIDSLQIVGGALPTIVYVSSGTLQAGLSDARLKNNITDLEPQLHKLNEIRCRRFDWRETGGHDIGLIAQELECIYPDLVFTEQDDYKGIYHDRLTILLLKSVQELASRVAHLESFINI